MSGTEHESPEPYSHAGEHLGEEGIYLTLLLKMYILRYWRRLTDLKGNLEDLYVGVHEVLHELGARDQAAFEPPAAFRASEAALGGLKLEIEALRQHIAARLSVTEGALPIEDLRARLRLDEHEVDVILVLARLQSDVSFRRLCSFAWADASLRQPDVAFLVELLSAQGGGARRQGVLRALAPGGRLAARRVVALLDREGWPPPTPPAFRVVRLADAVTELLVPLDEAPRAPRGASWVRVGEAPGLDGLFIEPRAQRDALDAVAQAVRHPESGRVALHGPAQVGKAALASAIARDLDRPLLAVRVEELLDGSVEAALGAIDEALLLATLHDAIVLLDLGVRRINPGEVGDRQLVRGLTASLRSHEGLVLLAAVEPPTWAPAELALRGCHLPPTPPALQQRAWHEALGACGLEIPGGPELLANRFNLGAGQIVAAVAEVAAEKQAHAARRRRQRDVPPAPSDEELLLQVVQRQLRHRMGSLATAVTTERTWDDLVLPEGVKEEIFEVERTIRHQLAVYHRWGFRAIAAGRGLVGLFSGPPGTGKTLTAGILGKALGRAVYRIDLSRVVDKYVGETEKHLEQLFDESEHAQAVLLFDEADSLFTQRTSVQSSHDRYANLQVNFLLQRIETFEGVCILTTNHEQNIDPAFKRRLHFVVRFPEPDAAMRASIWRALIPPQAELAPDIAWATLGARFEFSGGHIRNAVLRAAFKAAADGTPITQHHLDEAAAREARQLGLLVHPPARRKGQTAGL